MFGDLIDAHINTTAVEGTNQAVGVTPESNNNNRGNNGDDESMDSRDRELDATPRPDRYPVGDMSITAAYLVGKAGIVAQEKVTFITEVVGYDSPSDLYRTGRDKWSQINTDLGGPLNQKDLDILGGFNLWQTKFSSFEREMPSFDPFRQHGIRNKGAYLRLLGELENESPFDRSTVDPRTENSLLSHLSKLTDSLRGSSKSEEKKPTRNKLKIDLSMYPNLPGKKWETSKTAFLAVASAHGLLNTLQGLPDGASESDKTSYKEECDFMHAALMLATNSGTDNWIIRQFQPHETVKAWQAICESHEGAGSIRTRHQHAMQVLQSTIFNGETVESYADHCSTFMEAVHILEEIGHPQDDATIRIFFLNGIASETCQNARYLCESLEYDLNRSITEIRRAIISRRSGTAHVNIQRSRNTETAQDHSKELDGLSKYLGGRIPSDVWSRMSTSLKKAWRRKNWSWKKTNGVDDRSTASQERSVNHGESVPIEHTLEEPSPQVRFASEQSQNTNGNDREPILRNGRNGGDRGGGDRNGGPLLPSNTTRIQHLLSRNHVMRSSMGHSHVHNVHRSDDLFAYVDGGADTCLFNPDHVHVESITNRTAVLNTVGSEGSRADVKIGTCVITVELEDVPVLLVFNESLIGRVGDTNIVSANQVRNFGHSVDDVGRLFGGGQCMQLASSQTKIPLDLRRALVRLPFSKPTSSQLDECERIYMTSDQIWNPEDVQVKNDGRDSALGAISRVGDPTPACEPNRLHRSGEPHIHDSVAGRTRSHTGSSVNVINRNVSSEPSIEFLGDICPLLSESNAYYGNEPDPCELQLLALEPHVNDPRDILDDRSIALRSTAAHSLDPSLLATARTTLGWISQSIADRTLEATTQLSKNFLRLPLRRHFKSREPILNRNRLAEDYCTDTFFSETKSIEGKTSAQIFVGKRSSYTRVYGMRSEREAPTALSDFVRDVGAPYGIHSDNAKAETSRKWKDILRQYQIAESFTEPHHPQQNPAERRIGTVKELSRRLLDRSGAPAYLWYRAMLHAANLLNVTAHANLLWRTPTEAAFRETPDISAFLQFEFYQRVLYLDPTAAYPRTKELPGRFVGVADNTGDALTFYVLTDHTNQVIARSVVRPATDDPLLDNQRVSPEDEAQANPVVTPCPNEPVEIASLNEHVGLAALTVNPTDLTGYSFVDTNGDHLQKATVVARDEQDPDKWLIRYLHGGEDVRPYHEVIGLINKTSDDGESLWTFTKILDHRRDRNQKWRLKVLWDNGETTWEPLHIIKETDPVTVAEYGSDRNLVGKSGWRWARDYLPDGRTFNLLCKILKLNRKRLNSGTRYMFGVAIPRNCRQAYEFDRHNGNTAWTDAIAEEMDKIAAFGTFEALPGGSKPPGGYQHVPLHMCFAVKWDGRHKARLVAGGNWTEPDGADVYSGVVTSEAVRIGLMIASVNDLDIRVGDVGNAYLHSYTKERENLHPRRARVRGAAGKVSHYS